jgi:hypothetical protein
MATRKKPGIGEKRKTRQPFAIDKLPDSWRQKVIALRADWKTWEQISEASAGWDWSKEVTPEVRVLFRNERLAPTTLARWYDVQVEQKLIEVAAEAESSRTIAKVFAGKNFDNLDESVVNALADQAFAIVKSADPKNRAKLTGELTALGLSLSRIQRTQVARERLALEKEKLGLERDKLENQSPREIYLQAAEDLLKALRTRTELRKVLDPISKELVEEFSTRAESFAKQIETRPA